MKEFSGVFSDPLVVSRNKSIKECSRSIGLCLVPEAFRRFQIHPGGFKSIRSTKKYQGVSRSLKE